MKSIVSVTSTTNKSNRKRSKKGYGDEVRQFRTGVQDAAMNAMFERHRRAEIVEKAADGQDGSVPLKNGAVLPDLNQAGGEEGKQGVNAIAARSSHTLYGHGARYICLEQ